MKKRMMVKNLNMADKAYAVKSMFDFACLDSADLYALFLDNYANLYAIHKRMC